MKTIRSRPLVGLALTCLALTGPASLLAGNTFVISTFDSDLGSLPYGTNLWADGAGASATSAVYFTNSFGNPSGAMAMDFSFAQGTGPWQWQDYLITVQPFGAGGGGDGKGINMAFWDYIEFDFACNTNNSVVNTSYAGNPYGGIGVIGQGDPGWGDNSTNAFPTGDPLKWHQFSSYLPTPATNGWYHAKFPVNGGFGSPNGNTLNRLILQCFEYPDTNGTTKAEFLIDNVQFTSLGKPPSMAYEKAIRGLNLWVTSGGNDRNSIETYQDNANYYYMWAGNGAARYSFTLTNWPTGPAQTALLFRMDLVPTDATEGAPDWNEANCIMTEVGADTNGNALWFFRWKTNSPGGNGQYYNAASQIMLTNPTPLGTWTLAFDGLGTGVTMTAPGGNSTNFVMGSHPNVPDIHNAFVESSTNRGVVYLGILGGGTNIVDQKVVLASALLSGNITYVSNNWMADPTLTNSVANSVWVPVAGVQWYIVPTNNAMWVNWTVPDGGFVLQTNTVGLTPALNWSTNHGLPRATLFATHRGLLVKPGDLPNTPRLFFRMSSPGF